ncbi:hypothetical protein O205_10475 [Bacillus amyloliquefaciens EGD-AQ14]|nr:hypothetical protein O205_10475 [Bacillus amyloliquefaciens EGD-AQ14]
MKKPEIPVCGINAVPSADGFVNGEKFAVFLRYPSE